MPCTWLAVREAMWAITSFATFTEPSGRSGMALDSLHVSARPRVDPDHVAFVDEEGHVEGHPGLDRGRCAAPCGRITFETLRSRGHLEINGGGALHSQRPPVIHEIFDRAVLLPVRRRVGHLVI